ncbi:MAG TPA: hypothetical protein VMP03_03280 [Methylomirabilota bacterium]|nr:hypothetical protein [Methylomirabilota bacterium]
MRAAPPNSGWRGPLRTILAAASALWAVSAPAADLCLAVDNVERWDFLNIREKPSHLSAIAAAITPGTPAVMWVRGPCVPLDERPTRRWCPVDYYPLPTVVRTGYVKAFFTKETDCPAFRPPGPPPEVEEPPRPRPRPTTPQTSP